ncbi:hypothetical protein DL98DRAFT_578564 [Cadophora sp. DSE1049]|nr:hypothetical protein DL98DRAFT_578564 [Cadophora sp. DSE1049]
MLIPTPNEIKETFEQGRNTWQTYLSVAKGATAPSIHPASILLHVPPLPCDLRGKRELTGQAIWQVPDPGGVQKMGEGGGWDSELVHGAQKTFSLWLGKPATCSISSTTSFRHSVSESDAVINLSHASTSLVRWLCALLTPEPASAAFILDSKIAPSVHPITSLCLYSRELMYAGSLARPDIDVAIWTGSHQSFLDELCDRIYIDSDDMISRADLLRHRLNFRLGDSDTIHFGWEPPLGSIKKAQVEPELLSRLGIKYLRAYKGWVWCLGQTKLGDHIQYSKELIPADYRSPSRTSNSHSHPEPPSALLIPQILVGASKKATFRVLEWGSKMATGDQYIDGIGISDGTSDGIDMLRAYPWLADMAEVTWK